MKECKKKCPYGRDPEGCRYQLKIADEHEDYIFNSIIREVKIYCLKTAERREKDDGWEDGENENN